MGTGLASLSGWVEVNQNEAPAAMLHNALKNVIANT
jgi:hypothetical protein